MLFWQISKLIYSSEERLIKLYNFRQHIGTKIRLASQVYNFLFLEKEFYELLKKYEKSILFKNIMVYVILLNSILHI